MRMLTDRAVEIVSKSDSSTDFYTSVAKQIDKIFQSVIEKNGGAMSLIDVYLYYNRMRGSELITPDDLLQATRHFAKIKSILELREAENGMKIV